MTKLLIGSKVTPHYSKIDHMSFIILSVNEAHIIILKSQLNAIEWYLKKNQHEQGLAGCEVQSGKDRNCQTSD